MTWGDVKGDKIILKEKKTGKGREIPIHKELMHIIKEERPLVVKDTDHIFMSAQGKVMGKHNMIAMVKRYMVKSGVMQECQGATHIFRKTFGRTLFDKNEDKGFALVLLMDIFNHSSPEITKAYLGLRKEEINEAYASVSFVCTFG